jgi:general secretion pathway protein F
MPAFEYTALDSAGRTRKGVVESDSVRQARQFLREKEWIPLAVEAAASRKLSGVFAQDRKISNQDMVLVTRQLSTLVASGLPVDEAIKAAADQSEKRRTVKLLLDIRARVLEGRSLAEAIAEYPGTFPKVYGATIAAGEHSGQLDLILERLADYIETAHESRQKISLALLYPFILLVLSFLVVFGLLSFVVPKIVAVFANTGQELPLLTRGLIGLSDFMSDNYIYLLGIVVGSIAAYRIALQYEHVQYAVDKLKLRLPIYAKISRGLNTARFVSTLSILSESGIALVDGMKIAVEVVDNRHIKSRIKMAIKNVIEGASLRASLGQTACFPPMMIHMIGSGETSGSLEKMLARTASSQQREIENKIAVLIKLFEPMVLIFMGVIVMLIVLAILLPIMNMNRLIL